MSKLMRVLVTHLSIFGLFFTTTFMPLALAEESALNKSGEQRNKEAIATEQERLNKLSEETAARQKEIEDYNKTLLAQSKKESENVAGTIETASKDRLLTHDMISSLTMLASGALAAKILVMCTLKSLDMKLVGAAGVTYMAGEVMSIMQYKRYKEAREKARIEYTLEGTAEQQAAQVKHLEDVVNIFNEARKAAKKKMKIQQIAAAGFFAAGGYAMLKTAWLSSQKASCLTAAAAAGSKPDISGATAGACMSTQALCYEIDAAMLPKGVYGPPSKAVVSQLTASETALKGTDAICGSVACTNYVLQVAAEHGVCNPEATSSVFGSVDQSKPLDPGLMPLKESLEKFAEYNGKKELFSLENGISKDLIEVINSYRQLGGLNFDSKDAVFKDASQYIVKRDADRFIDGELSSTSINQYEKIDEIIITRSHLEDKSFIDHEMTNTYDKVLETLMPSAHASGLIPGLNIGAAVLGVLLAMTMSQAIGLDSLMASPTMRSVAWMGMGVLAQATVGVTGSISNRMSANIAKVKDIIKKMRRVSSQRKQTEIVQNSDQITSAKKSFDLEVGDDGRAQIVPEGTFPCLTKNKSGKCTSVAEEIKKDKNTPGFAGSFANVAGLNGAISDSIINSGSLSADTVNQINSFDGNKLAAIKRKAKELVVQLDKQKLKDFPSFSKMGENFQNRLKASTINAFSKAKDKETLLAGFGNITTLSRDVASSNEGKKAVANNNVVKPNLGDIKVNFPKLATFNAKLKLNKESDNLKEQGDLNEELNANDFDLAEAQNLPDAIGRKGADGGIVRDPDADIFNIISTRYLKSGLGRLLGRGD